jgi:HSP20 family protein
MATRKGVGVTRADRPAGVRLVKPEKMWEQCRSANDAIERRAFEIFERNGRQMGRDWENWFRAESELFHPTHVEIAEADDVLTLKAEVPGFSERDLQVSLEPHRVTIAGKRESREKKKSKQMLYTERCSDEIFRIVDLPKEINLKARGIRAKYDQGVLTITLPEAERPRGRQFESTSSTA